MQLTGAFKLSEHLLIEFSDRTTPNLGEITAHAR